MNCETLKIPGSPVLDNTKLRRLKKRVAELCRSKNESFPGAQPISFTSNNLEDLNNEDFFISEKADGLRCLMFLIKDDGPTETYMIDRKNEYYFLEMGLPTRTWGHWRTDTILDGELVLDIHPTDKKYHLVYLVFDCICMDGYFLSDKEYNIRLGFIKDHIMTPMVAHASRLDEIKMLKFPIALKHLETAYNIKRLSDLMKSLNHKSDGIVFTSRKSPYITGTCNTMLKWKTNEDNTVDFELRILNGEYNIYVKDKNGLFHIGLMRMPLDANKRCNLHILKDGDIVECRYLRDTKEWEFTRIRTDKPECNFITTYNNVLDSINNSVSMGELFAKAGDIKKFWRKREEDNENPAKKHINSAIGPKELYEFCSNSYKEFEQYANSFELSNPYKGLPNITTDLSNDLL